MPTTFEEKTAPTIVEGVVQFRIPVDKIDFDHLSPDYKRHLVLTPDQLNAVWIDYSAKALWESPSIQRMERGQTLHLKGGSAPDSMNIKSFLDTAQGMKLISAEVAREQSEIWQIRNNQQFFAEVNQYDLRTNFWPIHYMDYHRTLLRRGGLHGLLTEEKIKEIDAQLLAMPLADLEDPMNIRAKIDALSGDTSLYGRLERILQSVYVFASGEFINVFDLDAIQSSIRQLAKKNLFLSPGFESTPLSDLRLISMTDLASMNQPEIVVDALMAVTTYGCGLGKGNVIKTHSLFPGEKAVLTIESYSKEASSYALTSSVLDSTSTQAEDALQREASVSSSWNKESTRVNSFSVGIEAKASWGWGSGGGSASSSGTATDVSRNALSNVEKAVRNQASKVSNNRSVKIDTTSTRTTENSQRESVVRTIENINVSRPLNFVFRQLVQDVVSLYTVKDVRVVVRPTVVVPGTLTPLENIKETLASVLFTPETAEAIIEKYVQAVANAAIDLGGVDTLDKNRKLAVQYVDPKGVKRWQVDPGLRDRQAPLQELANANSSLKTALAPSASFRFDGILTDTRTYTLKTEGVYVDCFLSDTEGLDEYSKNLQLETVKEKQRGNEHAEQTVKLLQLAQALVSGGKDNAEKAVLFEKLVVPIVAAMNPQGGK